MCLISGSVYEPMHRTIIPQIFDCLNFSEANAFEADGRRAQKALGGSDVRTAYEYVAKRYAGRNEKATMVGEMMGDFIIITTVTSAILKYCY